MKSPRDAVPADLESAAIPLPNQALSDALRDAQWGPRDLIRALNRRLEASGHPTFHVTTGQVWVKGGRPRSEYARCLTVGVLSEATGQSLSAAHLWGEPALDDVISGANATDGLIGRPPVADVLATATDWTAATPGEQAALRPASDSQLLSAVWDATRQSPMRSISADAQEQVLPAFVDTLEDHLAGLRRLDDTAGGGALSQRYVRTELAGVLDLIRNSSYTPAVGTRLLALAGGMAQLSGWMAFDADLDAAAQRYQLLAIRLARAADDTTTVANILGMLAYQHAAAGKPAAALRYAEAAVDHTAHSSPLVRARAWGRMATAHAAAGDINAFRDATDRCRALLEHRRNDDPASLYYFTPEQVSAETGHALVELAAANPASTRRLLAEATTLLTPLTDHGPATGYPRSALLHGIHLAHAHLLARDPDATATTLLQLADRVPDVQSIRCRNLLRQVRRSAGPRLLAPDRARALNAIDRALSTA